MTTENVTKLLLGSEPINNETQWSNTEKTRDIIAIKFAIKTLQTPLHIGSLSWILSYK